MGKESKFFENEKWHGIKIERVLDIRILDGEVIGIDCLFSSGDEYENGIIKLDNPSTFHIVFPEND